MKVFCHKFSSRMGLISYKGLNTIDDVDEVVLYNEAGKIAEIFEKADYEAVAIFSPTTFVVKKGNRYYWSDVPIEIKNAETIYELKNGNNYVKEKDVWMLLEITK